ncbi:MAG: hypothetical protein AAB585_00550 [Patescibacteria group bacterium]
MKDLEILVKAVLRLYELCDQDIGLTARALAFWFAEHSEVNLEVCVNKAKLPELPAGEGERKEKPVHFLH